MVGIVRVTLFSKLEIMFKKLSMVLLAVMLGMSNAILEENRTLTDSRLYPKRTEIPADDDTL
ncbi:hypothetical protein D1013_17335 [Euzebyella marina]|uniref:Uncharacterized protein n=1 Tax=Euzebyella marina TaxID=1761453 RepID=A0A3G2L9S5_9FLAO|nr:hypothetical protein D1013_17335 [Euzebyella marina]